MDIFYIYAHRHNKTNKIFYIGKGQKDRAYEKKRRNNVWHLIAKDGYTVEIIAENLEEQEAYNREYIYISLFKSLNCCQANLFTGCGVKKPLYYRPSKIQILEESKPISASELNIERPLSVGKKKQVIDIVTKQIWCSVSEAARCNNIKQPTLNRYLNGQRQNPTSLRFLGE